MAAEAIARVGDSTVSAALRRVPGLTLVNDQFIYVRGLGERYSSAQLNGAQVPSPDLTRNVIPLDIFPTDIIQAIQNAWPDLVSGNGGITVQSPLGLSDVDPSLLSPGKQRLVEEKLRELQGGLISTGAGP